MRRVGMEHLARAMAQRIERKERKRYTVQFCLEFAPVHEFGSLLKATRFVSDKGFSATISRDGVPIFAWDVLTGWREL